MPTPSTEKSEHVNWRDKMREKLRVKDGEIHRLRDLLSENAIDYTTGDAVPAEEQDDDPDEVETPFDGNERDSSYLEKD